ncbi:MAG TPA: flagellar basal body rod protein FlgC [Phycisphaerae bacterium]|nr:flagellar basal body rod protein FlgC [Phycisphaerae bacterium]
MFGALDISTSGLVAQRVNLDNIAGNIANALTTRRTDGKPGPYLRRVALLASGDGKGGPGVHVQSVVEDTQSKPRLVKDPGNPDADAKGMVAYPNVDMSTEMIDAIVATRAYEANITAVDATKTVLASTLRILA